MTTHYWVGDELGRVLGPATLTMISELVTRGRLHSLTRGSTDGKSWRPIDSFPELRALFVVPNAISSEQALAELAARVRADLDLMRKQSPRARFGARESATRDECRTIFFAKVKRYHASRLPPDAPPSLTSAFAEMAELLGASMAEIERAANPGASSTYAPAEFVGWYQDDSGAVHVDLEIGPDDAHYFTDCDQSHVSNDGFYLPCNKPLPLLQLVDVNLRFKSFHRELKGRGRVVLTNPPGRPPGLGIRLLSPSEDDRKFLQYFVKKFKGAGSAAHGR